ncbi:MAG: VanW family protein, partial [Hungatella sp.]
MSTGNNNKASGTRGKNSKQSADRSRQNKSRTGQNTRKSAAARVRRNTKRRRQPSYDYKMIAIIGVCLIFLITGLLLSLRHFTNKNTTPVTTVQTETELQKDVIVDGIPLTGMSREKAKATLLKHYEWGMKVTYEGAEAPYEIPNLMEGKVNALLEEIFTGKPQESYTLDTTGLEEAIAAEVKAIAKKWDVPARNGAISGFNKENGTFIYSGEQNGKILNQEQLSKDMTAALADKNFRSVLIAQGTVVAPEITEAQAKELYQVIGTKTTTTTANSDRNTNVQLAANALNGLIVQPGEEFSFNSTTGNRTLERGYKPAGAYVNGVLVEEPGGGVCQVSSTLYNAVVFAGLTTTERHAHSYEPSYITPGEDAMVSYDGYAGPDMRFVNNSKDAIAI